jgi:hypothetical protein
MTKIDWLMLLTIVIPVLPALLREARLFWAARRKFPRRRGAHEDTCDT